MESDKIEKKWPKKSLLFQLKWNNDERKNRLRI